jgi:Na+-driven multidrug efflux pump
MYSAQKTWYFIFTIIMIATTAVLVWLSKVWGKKATKNKYDVGDCHDLLAVVSVICAIITFILALVALHNYILLTGQI